MGQPEPKRFRDSRQDEDHSIVDHEHRKRHEEEDNCPEEIKQM